MDGHIELMSRTSNRDKILTAGMQVVHAHGFANASVRDIVQAAGVPQGSFTNHFASKEAFGLEILDLYFAGTTEAINSTLLNETLAPLDRLAAYIDRGQDLMMPDGRSKGCMLGNFAAETVADNTVIRAKLQAIFEAITTAIATCLETAVAARQVPADLDVKETAALILQSLQGAILLSKAYGDCTPVARFKKTLFEKILQ
jgi:TetR/AcrR family transcriptional repressor of nem operon